MQVSQRKGSWIDSENESLRRAVAYYGPSNWVRIAQEVPGRTAKQCRERWHQNLDPRLSKSEITPDEGRYIIQQVELCGNAWAAIASRLPGRCDNQVKNWYHGWLSRGEKSERRKKKAHKRNMDQARQMYEPSSSSPAYQPHLPQYASRQELALDPFYGATARLPDLRSPISHHPQHFTSPHTPTDRTQFARFTGQDSLRPYDHRDVHFQRPPTPTRSFSGPVQQLPSPFSTPLNRSHTAHSSPQQHYRPVSGVEERLDLPPLYNFGREPYKQHQYELYPNDRRPHLSIEADYPRSADIQRRSLSGLPPLDTSTPSPSSLTSGSSFPSPVSVPSPQRSEQVNLPPIHMPGRVNPNARLPPLPSLLQGNSTPIAMEPSTPIDPMLSGKGREVEHNLDPALLAAATRR